MKKAISLLMAVCMLFCAIPMIEQPAEAATYQERYQAFINDSRWSNGTLWGYYQAPKSNYAENCIGCAAYVADFATVVYGQNDWVWNHQIPFSGAQDIKSGDIIYRNDTQEHWLVVLERNGNTLYTAEGNIFFLQENVSKVYISNSAYWIDGENIGSAWNGTFPVCALFRYEDSAPTYSLDVNLYLDGVKYDTGREFCTFDVYTNGVRDSQGNDVKDWMKEGFASGTSYKIDDIKINGCYKNNGKTSYTGTITGNTVVNLEVVTYHPPKTVAAKAATCTETGLTSGTVCSKCGKVLTAQTTIPAKGHSYTSEIIPGSCTEPAKIKYTCSGCGDTYTTVPGEEWSDWSTSVPPAGAEIESKTQWSASRKDMKTSSQSSMSGYELDSSATQYGVWQNAGWTSTKPTENDVKRITETRKVVDSNAYTEYKYYHYYGYDGNTLYNSYGNYYWKNYESTVSTTAFPLDKAYDGYQGYAKNVGLHGSLWFLESTTNVPEKSHTEWFYQTRTATYTFYKWSDYGAWQDTEIKADDNTRVQTRTAYRYRLKAADVAGHTWNSGVVTTPATCTAAGVKTFTCTVCTATKTETITKLDHVYVNKADAKYLKSAATETSAAVYYKSCSVCGVKGTATFTYGDPVPPAVETDTVLGVSSAKTMAGKEITLTLSLEKNPGMAGLSVSLNYDTNALTLKSANNSTLFTSLTSGKNFIFDNASNVTSDGTVATFTFTVNDNAAAGDYTVTPVVRSCVNDEGEDVPVKVEKGTVTVIDFIYGDANDDEVIDMKDVVLLRRYLAEFDYETNSSPVEIGFGADANGDNAIDMKDVVLVRKYLANYDYDTNTSTEVLGPQ